MLTLFCLCFFVYLSFVYLCTVNPCAVSGTGEPAEPVDHVPRSNQLHVDHSHHDSNHQHSTQCAQYQRTW